MPSYHGSARALNDDAGLIADVKRALGMPAGPAGDLPMHQADPRIVARMEANAAAEREAERRAAEQAATAELRRRAEEHAQLAAELRAKARPADPIAAGRAHRDQLRAGLVAALTADSTTEGTNNQ